MKGLGTASVHCLNRRACVCVCMKERACSNNIILVVHIVQSSASRQFYL